LLIIFTVVYEIAFTKRPSVEHWEAFASTTDFDANRVNMLEEAQGTAAQYLLAYFLLQFIKNAIPSPKAYREEALHEGVKAGKIKKSGGSIVSTESEQEFWLENNSIYQTWRL